MRGSPIVFKVCAVGLEKFAMQGFPIHRLELKDIGDHVCQTCLRC